MAKKGGLGKGLDALFLDNNTVSDTGAVFMKTIDIEPNKNQPRKDFDNKALLELAESIKNHGIIQPLLVRPLTNGMYQIVAGERRWRASRMLGLTEVPVVIRELDDEKTMEIALIENLQREGLNPIEEAMGFQQLIEDFGLKQEEVAESVGKSRSAIANALRLLNLPKEVLTMVRSGEISSGHARAILTVGTYPEKVRLAKQVLEKGLSVRDAERIAKEKSTPPKFKDANFSETKSLQRDTFFEEMEIALRQELARKIKIIPNGEKGTIEIDFYSKQELADIAQRLVSHRK